MANYLVIVESPAKACTIKKFLGQGYEVKACMGHIKDLPQKDLGVDVDDEFRPHYTVIKGKGKVIKELRTAAKKADAIYLAPDPDREGEAIAWHVAQELAVDEKKIHRILFNEITKKAISTAVQKPRSINMDLVNAQQARRIMDRLVGYKVSPFLWRTMYRGLSAGRVQSVALRLISEREELIEKFVAQEYWSIAANLQGKEGEAFIALLATIDGKKVVVSDQKQAGHIVEMLKSKPFTVAGVDRKQQKRNPLPPFITSSLQQDAARALRFNVHRTMRVAQQLYEGMDIGQKSPVGLITYMRTDAPRVAQEALEEVRRFIETRFGEKYLPPQPRSYKSKRGAQEAHEAIRPYPDCPRI
jgi:DNA topoisomerase-1